MPEQSALGVSLLGSWYPCAVHRLALFKEASKGKDAVTFDQAAGCGLEPVVAWQEPRTDEAWRVWMLC